MSYSAATIELEVIKIILIIGQIHSLHCSKNWGWSKAFCSYSNRKIEPTHEILALFVLRKCILQIRMHSHPVGLDVWFLVWPFVYFFSSCVRTAKALARLRACAGSPEPSLVAFAISTIISWADSLILLLKFLFAFQNGQRQPKSMHKSERDNNTAETTAFTKCK